MGKYFSLLRFFIFLSFAFAIIFTVQIITHSRARGVGNGGVFSVGSGR